MKRWILTLGALALPLVAASCDNIGDSVNPGLEPSPMVVMSTTGQPYVVAMELNPDVGSITAEVGEAGGELTLGKHKLYISAGAVSAPTTFTMSRELEFPLRVKLSATQDTPNDVGAAGFAAPVTLKLFYGNALHLPVLENSLTQLYMRPDGLVETLTTQIDPSSKTATSKLPHFSDFALGWP